MKHFIYIVLSLAVGTSLSMILLSPIQFDNRTQEARAVRAIGNPDDPFARAAQEFLMLRDPVTGEIPKGIRAQELDYAQRLRSSAWRAFPKSTELNWKFAGPDNVAGRTRALAVDVANENHLVAGGVSGGVWQSSDGGTSWVKTTLPNQIHSVTCVAQDKRPENTSTWYYGTGEYSGNSAGEIDEGVSPYFGDGIFKSTDNGTSWQKLASTSSETPQEWDGDFDIVWNLATNPSNTQAAELYAAVYGGILVSLDGGVNWNSAIGDLQTGTYSDVAVTSSGRVFAALSSDADTDPGIFMAENGTNWQDITPQGFPFTYSRIVIGVAPSNPNVAYFFVTYDYSEAEKRYGFWKYDANSGWEDRSANLPDPTAQNVEGIDSQGSYNQVVAVKPDDENTVFIGGTNLYRSTDGFASSGNTTWIGGYSTMNNIDDYPNHHPDQHAMVFSPANANVAYCGNDGGISKTTDIMASTPDGNGHTVRWERTVQGYVTTQFYGIAIDPVNIGDESIVGGLQDRGNFVSDNGQTGWNELSGGDGGFAAVGNNFIVISTQNGAIQRIDLNPQSVTDIQPIGASGQLFTTPYTLDPANTNIMYYAAGNVLWRNDNIPQATDSDGWTELSNAAADAEITAITVTKEAPQSRVYIGTANGSVYAIDNAHTGNPQAQQLRSGNGEFVSSIAVDPADGASVLVALSNYKVPSLHYSTDAGSTWATVGGTLEENPDGSGAGPSTRWVSILRVDNDPEYLVGTSVGLFSASTLSGDNTQWVQEGATTIGNVVVSMIATRDADNFIAVATHGAGVYSAQAQGSTSRTQPGDAAGFALNSFYPNPTASQTSVTYNTSVGSRVSLRLYDSKGTLVSVLADGWNSAGTHRATLDVHSGLPAGVYFCRMLATGSDGAVMHQQTRKLLIAR